MSHACHHFWKCYKTLTFCSLLTRCTIPCASHAKRHLNVQKCSVPVRTPQFFPLLTSKCASRHNGVHFFDISTSKSGPNMRCLVHSHLQMCFAPQRRALFWHLNFQKRSEHEVFCAFSLANVLLTTTVCTFSTSQLLKVLQSCATACTFLTSQLPKAVRTWGVLCIFTCKCASHHNGVRFFDISTSKSAPKLRCFVHLHLQMCFAPQRRALFWHLNFQKCSEREAFCVFSLANVLRATTACTFSTSQLPKVVRRWGVLYILTWTCASRHNGVHFFDISTSKSGPELRCFVHFESPGSFREKVLTGYFVEKRGLQNTNPSRRMAPNALQNTSLGNPKWLPTTKYKTKIIKNHQIRAVYKIDWKKVAPSKARKCPKQALWGMSRLVFCRESTLKYFKSS